MILSVSRRTDIPSYYSEWFYRRLKEGFVWVRNPMNPKQISEISLSPEVVDGIVFWTKNPAPMLERLEELSPYSYYFQFTLTPYDRDVECNLPPKEELIATFQRLSAAAGRERVVWRYDPILLNEKYTIAYHVQQFEYFCDQLAACTEKCTISFLDLYQNMKRRIAPLHITAPTPAQQEELAQAFGEIATAHGLGIDTCAETADFARFGIGHAACIDRERLERIAGCSLHLERDRNQRAACGCAASIDIGAYHTCRNGCIYCYANHDQRLVNESGSRLDLTSPLLCSQRRPEDQVKIREVHSCREGQISLFEL